MSAAARESLDGLGLRGLLAIRGTPLFGLPSYHGSREEQRRSKIFQGIEPVDILLPGGWTLLGICSYFVQATKWRGPALGNVQPPRDPLRALRHLLLVMRAQHIIGKTCAVQFRPPAPMLKLGIVCRPGENKQRRRRML
jgi:hypothetical protein